MPSAYTTILQQFYLAYFGRPADPVGLQTTSQALANAGAPTTLAGLLSSTNATVIALINGFGSSAESTALYTGGTTARVTAIYQNVLNRNPDVGGLLYWSTEIDSGRLSLARVALAVIEAGARDVNDGPLVTAKTNVAISYTASVDTVAEINAYNGNTAAASARTLLSTVTATTTTAAFQASVDSNIAALVSTNGGAAVGVNLVLTTGVDTINGTSGNDTITADNTLAAKQLTVADTINGGAGIDTLRIFLAAADTATGQPAFTGIETVLINGGAVTAYTAAAGTTGLTIDAPVADTKATFTLAGQSLTLSNFATANATTTTIATGTATALGLTLSGVGAKNTIDLSAATVTSLNLANTVANNSITLTNTGAALATLTLSGDKTFSAIEAIASLKTINASAATASVTIDASTLAADNQLTFTGGTANDTLIFKAAFLTAGATGDVLDGGAGSDTLVINDTTPIYAAINAAKGFEVLGLGTTATTVDASQVTVLSSFAVRSGVATTTFNNTSNTTTVAADNSAGLTAVTIANSVGQGTANFTLTNSNTATPGAQTLGTLTLTGSSTINLVSANNANALNTNVITTLTNGDNVSVNISGAAGLTVSLAAGTAVGSALNGSTATGVLTLSGSNFGDVISGGTAADILTGGAGADALTGNAGNDTFVFASRATTQLNFAATDTTTANIDRITDFVGNGAAAGDSFRFGLAAAAFGTGVTFTGATTSTVTAVTVATAASFTALAAAVQAASAGVATSSTAAQYYDVTVTAGSLAGRFLILNDEVAAVAATDTFIAITGAAAINAQDIAYA